MSETQNQNKSTGPSTIKSGSNKPAKESAHVDRVMIQIERPGEKKLDMPSITSMLKDTGIRVDPNYGPFLVNPKQGRFVLRGFGTAEALEKAKRIPGVMIFGDKRVISPI